MNSDHCLIFVGFLFVVFVMTLIFIVAEREFFSLLPKQYRRRIKDVPDESYFFGGNHMFFIKSKDGWKSWNSCGFYLKDSFLIIRPTFPFGTIIKSAKIPIEDMYGQGCVTKYFRSREMIRLSKGHVEILIPSIVWRKLIQWQS